MLNLKDTKPVVLCELIFGSHMYGLNTPASDMDYKGVFQPSLQDLVLCKAPKHYSRNTKTDSSIKNTNLDVDKEVYSIQYFLEMAMKGETVAIDMLHASDSAIITCSPIWQILRNNKSSFYTKNLTALVGYARHQAAKYGVKGSRLHDAKIALEVLRVYPDDLIKDIWDKLPVTDNLVKVYNEDKTPKLYEICGKKLTLTAKCKTYFEMVQNFVDRYSERAKMAELSEGVDWKAITHAFRAAYQVKHIFLDGGFTYPLPETDFLMRCKRGELHYGKEAGPKLDELLDEVMKLRELSKLPEKVDSKIYNEFILNLYE